MSQEYRDQVQPSVAGYSAAHLLRDVGLALTAMALSLVLVSNLMDLARGKAQLDQLVARQDATLKTTGKAEAQLDALARGLQQLSSGGNANAQKIVSVLQANGVHIKP